MLHSELLGRPNVCGRDIQALNTPNIKADRHLLGKALNRPTATSEAVQRETYLDFLSLHACG